MDFDFVLPFLNDETLMDIPALWTDTPGFCFRLVNFYTHR